MPNNLYAGLVPGTAGTSVILVIIVSKPVYESLIFIFVKTPSGFDSPRKAASINEISFAVTGFGYAAHRAKTLGVRYSSVTFFEEVSTKQSDVFPIKFIALVKRKL